MAELSEEDADGLRDLADRSRRAARTARRVAPGSQAEQLLVGMADHLEGVAETADTVADMIERRWT
jgi:hypothetical protein